MDGMTGLKTPTGKPIYSSEYVENLRVREEKVKNSKYFIAQKGAQENDLHSNVDILVTGGNRGGGKANPYSTPVITPRGIVKMGDLQVGDYICTPYEGVQQVSEIFEQGRQTTYVFHFDDGTIVRCMDNHRFYARQHSDEPWMVWTARDIIDMYKIGSKPPVALRNGSEDYIEFPLCGEVELDESRGKADLPIHPLIAGLAMCGGYWHIDGNRIVAGNAFGAIKMAFACGYKTKKPWQGKVWISGITKEQRLGLTKCKGGSPVRIPKEYLFASKAARWDLLRGIMFCCGRSTKKHPCVESKNKAFCEDLAQLGRSLGMWAKVYEITDDMEKIGMWRCHFVAPSDKKLFMSGIYTTRARINGEEITECPVEPSNILTKKLLWVRRYEDKDPCRCITITGKDHLYLTDAYTINHNTALMLMEGIYDIDNKHYTSVLFRKNKDDFANIENESNRWFMGLGKYNKSKDDMTWNFKTGAKMSFDTFDMDMQSFDAKYRGQQYAYIGVDEGTQIPFEYLKILMGSNRNTVGVRSRILLTCNPDPMSWMRPFLDWWIGKEDTIYSDGQMHPERKGLPIPERDGVVRYCFMGKAESVDGIVWGDTPQEVYEQCRDDIDSRWDPSLEEFGYDKISFAVKSVTFIKASIQENKALLKNDPGYIASILNKSPEEVAKEWDGNWDVVKMGTDMIQAYHLEKIFANAHVLGDKVRRATCDVAGDGGDNCVTWLWIGWHVADVFVCRRDLYTTPTLLRGKLQEWGVIDENFAYDLNGVGQVIKGAFPKSIAFNNEEAVDPKYKYMYNNKKSQCAYKFAERTQQDGWSIEYTLLSRRYKVGKETRTLRDILQTERRCVKQDMGKADKGWCLIQKEQMKKRDCVGHSPDFFEALFMREIFELKSVSVSVPKFLQGHIRNRRVFSRSLINHN